MKTVCVCKCLPHASPSHTKKKVDPECAVNLNTVVGNGLFLGPGTLTGLGEGTSFISDMSTYKETKQHMKVAISNEKQVLKPNSGHV